MLFSLRFPAHSETAEHDKKGLRFILSVLQKKKTPKLCIKACIWKGAGQELSYHYSGLYHLTKSTQIQVNKNLHNITSTTQPWFYS